MDENAVVLHPLVIGELAVGCLPDRRQTLCDLQCMPQSETASNRDCLQMVEDRQLWGRGLQWNDIQLLAATFLSSDVLLWTHDRRLRAVADDFCVGFAEA